KAAGEAASFLVVMREQADLAGADSLSTRTEKTRFVFEALTAQAEASQASLRASLDARGISYRSYYLVNMIEVEGELAVAEGRATRDDASAVAPNPEVPLSRPDLPMAEPSSAHGLRLGADATVEPNITKIRAPEVWNQGFTGQGIVVGMADTGVV